MGRSQPGSGLARNKTHGDQKVICSLYGIQVFLLVPEIKEAMPLPFVEKQVASASNFLHDGLEVPCSLNRDQLILGPQKNDGRGHSFPNIMQR